MPDPNSILYIYTFDDDGRLAKMIDPSGRVTTYTYDADGRLIWVQNFGGPGGVDGDD